MYIKTEPTPYSVAQFVRWYRERSLDLNPEFQRRSVWKPGAKAYFINTLLRGFPVPPLYLRNLATNQRTLQTPKQVVDGQQRLRTVIAFVDPKALMDFDPDVDAFTLSAAHDEKYGGMDFGGLPKGARQQILDYQLSAHTFDADTSDAIVLQIFARMNSTGVKLNRQELRNAEYFGHFKSLAYQLAMEQLTRWIDWGVFTKPQVARMDEVEHTSDIMSLILKGITAKTPRHLDDLYKEYDIRLPNKVEIAKRIRRVFDYIEDSLRANADGLGVLAGKTLFFAGFAALYHKYFKLGSKLSRRKPKRVPLQALSQLMRAADRIEAGTAPAAAIEASTVRVTHAAARRILIKYFVNAVS